MPQPGPLDMNQHLSGAATLRTPFNFALFLTLLLFAIFAYSAFKAPVGPFVCGVFVAVVSWRYAPLIWRENDIAWDVQGVSGPRRITRLRSPERASMAWSDIQTASVSAQGYRITSKNEVISWSPLHTSHHFLKALRAARGDLFEITHR